MDIEDEKETNDFICKYGSPLVTVELRDLKTILHEIVLQDEVEYILTKTVEGNWCVEITRFYSDRLVQKNLKPITRDYNIIRAINDLVEAI